jgi:hypothetical protein
MGTSNWQNISYNIELVRRLNPKSILDVGVGFGRWGMLFREFLEIWESGRYNGEWQRIIEGVEIFPGYIKEYHKFFYNNIYIDDALNYLRNTEKRYDLIHFGDIIEHFIKKDGKELISLGLEKGKNVLINIPIGKHWKQEGTLTNPSEEHQSVWKNSDFTIYKYCIIKTFKDLNQRNFNVVLLSNHKIDFDKRFGKYFGI